MEARQNHLVHIGSILNIVIDIVGTIVLIIVFQVKGVALVSPSHANFG